MTVEDAKEEAATGGEVATGATASCKGVKSADDVLGRDVSAAESRLPVGDSRVQVAEAPASATEAKSSSPSSTSQSFWRKIKWAELWAGTKVWLSEPFNVALLVWILAVTVAGAILFMTMVGMLNAVIPSKTARDAWAEASNQVLNALFTLWCLLVQPWRIRYFIWVCRWTSRDRKSLRAVFSRAGPDYRVPNERRHMAVVAVFLNLNCLLQYCLAGVMWGIRAPERPPILVGVLLGSAFGCVAVAGVYCLFSPLGRPKPPSPQMTLHRDSYIELCASGAMSTGSTALDKTDVGSTVRTSEGTVSQSLSGAVEKQEEQPEAAGISLGSESQNIKITVPVGQDIGWDGPLLGCFQQGKSTLFVAFCCCCAFGRNLQSAGFGSKYLHTIMLLIFLAAPFIVCEFAALQVTDSRVATALIVCGILISYLGLLYGGYWRHQLVTIFRLPKAKFPGGWQCGVAGECFLWLTCCWCALCQEIRTVERYGLHVQFYPDDLDESSKEESAMHDGSSSKDNPQILEDAEIGKVQEPAATIDDKCPGDPMSVLAPPMTQSMAGSEPGKGAH